MGHGSEQNICIEDLQELAFVADNGSSRRNDDTLEGNNGYLREYLSTATPAAPERDPEPICIPRGYVNEGVSQATQTISHSSVNARKYL